MISWLKRVYKWLHTNPTESDVAAVPQIVRPEVETKTVICHECRQTVEAFNSTTYGFLYSPHRAQNNHFSWECAASWKAVST